MSPADFAAILKQMLKEKLRVSKANIRHRYDHISNKHIIRQKEQLLKRLKDPIDKLLKEIHAKDNDNDE